MATQLSGIAPPFFVFLLIASPCFMCSCDCRVKLYGCETWSPTLTEERGLRVFENRVLRRIFGLNRDEVTGEWRKLHHEELNDLYSLPNIVRVIKSRRMRWAKRVARLGEKIGVYRVLVGTVREGDHLGEPSVDGNIILNRSSGSGVWGYGLDREGSE